MGREAGHVGNCSVGSLCSKGENSFRRRGVEVSGSDGTESTDWVGAGRLRPSMRLQMAMAAAAKRPNEMIAISVFEGRVLPGCCVTVDLFSRMGFWTRRGDFCCGNWKLEAKMLAEVVTCTCFTVATVGLGLAFSCGVGVGGFV